MTIAPRVVRVLGSSRVHVVDVHPSQLAPATWIGDFLGAGLPLATRCGALLQDSTGWAVCMEPGTKVNCSRCRRITGLVEAPKTNTDLAAIEE